MNVTELKNDSTDFHVKVVISSTEVVSEINKELTKLAKTSKMDGFRVGKVPHSVLVKKYGLSLRADVAKNKIMKAVDDIVKDKNLRILMEPEVGDIINEENKDLEFTLKYQLLPEIKIPDFKTISIEKPILELKEKDINEQLEKLVAASKEYDKESKSKAKKGDQVTIDAVGYVENKEFAGGKLTAHKLILGSGHFIPGFEDQLIGAKNGDEVSVKVSFPKDYHEKSLAGKPSEFKVKVLAVHTETPAKLDDEFAKKFKVENLAQLKDQISKNLREVYEEPIETIMKMELFDKLENILNFEVPQALMEREIDILKKQANQIADEELESKSEKDKEAYFIKLALRRVKLGLMLAEYVKINNLQIEKSDINKAIISQAKNFPGRENEIINLYLKNPQALETLKGPVLEDKAVKIIFDKEVKLVEKSYSQEELESLLNKDNFSAPKAKKPKEKITSPKNEPKHVHGPNCNHDHDGDDYGHNHDHDRNHKH